MRRPRSHAREPIELTIEALGAGGDGVAQAGGDAVYVPWTLPGERVRARPVAPRRALPLEWLVRAPGRAEPACRHFGACGGCALQHLDPAGYAAWKQARAREALARAGFADAPLGDLVRARPGTRRRASFAARRVGEGAVLGFHAPLSAEIVDLAACAVLAPQLVALVPALRALAAAWLARAARCDFAATLTETGIDLLAIGAPAPDRAQRERLAAFAAEHDLARLARADSVDATPELLAQRRPPRVTFGGVAVEPPPAAFLQATADGESAIVAATTGALAGAKRVADLFAGTGTLALPLVAAGARVRAVDSAGASLAALDAAARRAGFGARLAVETRDLARRPLVGDELAAIDAVVFDPPREGARAQAEALAQAGPPRVVAVSCNPATFARDAAILRGGGYALERLTPIDQFLWSPHLELVGAFVRPGR